MTRWLWMCLILLGVGGGAAIFAAPGLADTGDVLGYSVHLPMVARSEPTPTPIPPTVAPPPTEEPTVEPTPQPVVRACNANLYNCADFATQAQAQACYTYCISQGAGDVHRLDADHDGIACEALP